MSLLRKQLTLAFLLFTFGISTAHAQITPPPTPTPILTTAQATQIATTFCSSLNVSGGTASAVYAPASANSGSQNYYWLPRWQVTFVNAAGLQSVVEVADANGTITSYHNYAMSQQALTNNTAAGISLAASTAIQNATSALQASGMPSDIASTPVATNMQITYPATSAGNLWLVSWKRQFNGIPYEREQVSFILQAQTGFVQSMKKSFPSVPPTSGVASVTASQASLTAQNKLIQFGITTATLQNCVKTVVQPNTKWQIGGSPTPIPNCAGIVVWDCVFSDGVDAGVVHQVWVDANTGAVAGGQTVTMSAAMKKAHKKNLKLKEHSKTATKSQKATMKTVTKSAKTKAVK